MISKPYAKVILWTKGHYEPGFTEADDPQEEFKRQLSLIGIPVVGIPTQGHKRQMELLWSALDRICDDNVKLLRALKEMLTGNWRKPLFTPFEEEASPSLWLRYQLKSHISMRDVRDKSGDILIPQDLTLEPIMHQDIGSIRPKPSSDYANNTNTS